MTIEPEDKGLDMNSMRACEVQAIDQPRASPIHRGFGALSIALDKDGQYSNVLLIVPALNEESGLPAVLGQAGQLGVATIVADASSTDRTCQVAKDFDVSVVTVARGKGRGWREILSQVDYTAWEWVALVDADATYDLLALPHLLESKADMIIGRRRPVKRAASWTRSVGDKFFSGLVSLITGRRCPDVLSGFRIMRSSCLKQMCFTSSNFELETELTLKFLRHGFTIDWVDIEYRKRLGHSKLKAVGDGWSILCAIFRYSLKKI